jgi:uncharacterized membrane protein
MNRDNDKDVLAEALAQLKQQGLFEQPPTAVAEETIRRLAEAQRTAGEVGATVAAPRSPKRIFPGRTAVRLSLGAAAMVLLGYALGRNSRPASVDMDELRETLAPVVAASIEPAIRQELMEELRRRYDGALVAGYVRVKEELTQQYRDDLNRFAVQMLTASNAATNQHLAALVENIDTIQAQDRKRIAQVLHQIELNRVQDRTQLAKGLQTLASRTEDKLLETRQQVVQLFANYQPDDSGLPPQSLQSIRERNEP